MRYIINVCILCSAEWPFTLAALKIDNEALFLRIKPYKCATTRTTIHSYTDIHNNRVSTYLISYVDSNLFAFHLRI